MNLLTTPGKTSRGLTYLTMGATLLEAVQPYFRDAIKAALLPTISTMSAIGIVALPGMMTGQILSGVSPLIAARYQIMVMCMIFGAAGLSTICFLVLVKGNHHLRNVAE